MGYFTEHIIPWAWSPGDKPEKYSFNTIEELINKNKEYLPDGYVFAYSQDENVQLLMISSMTEKEYWVLGYVEGFDLSKYLPVYTSTYKFNGNVKIVKNKFDACEWLVESESSNDEYSLISLDGEESFAWAKKKDFKFIRYATQEELDTINKAFEK